MQNIIRKLVLFCLTFVICTSANLSNAVQAADFSPTQLKKMSTFLSNFTELGFRDFDIKKDVDDDMLHLGSDPSHLDLIRFGIWHNYVNNFKSRIQKCSTKDCKYGSLVIDGQYVAESVKKYFAINLKNASVEQSDPPYHFDGKFYHFEGADGEAVYYAWVKQATQEGGIIRMTGELYNIENKNDRPATFVAMAKPYKWKGKDTWAILSMKTTQR